MRQGYGHVVLDDMVARVREVRARRRARLEAISTREGALAYRDEVRNKIASLFGPFPERTPLDARVGRTLERPGYRIENVVFASRPGCLVTGNLYVPERLDGPAPCVLGACGHTLSGKAADYNQNYAQRLVASGFVVFVFDPLNQGERIQYWNIPGSDDTANSPVNAHNMMAKQLELVGEDLPSWFAWDGIRALDYLLSRPEVDAQRVGVTGCSGGGTQTTWLWALDDRLTMAAPSCFVTTFESSLENEIPADAEQYPLGVLAAGLEHADFLIARAPAPMILLDGRYDYFDRRGTQEAYGDVQHIYTLLGAPEGTVAYYEGLHPHGYPREDQEEMVRFFARHAAIADIREVPETECLTEMDLAATPEGNVIAAGGTPVFEITCRRAEALAASRPALTPQALRERLRALLGIDGPVGTPHYRNLRPRRAPLATYARVAVETEGNIRALLHKRLTHPERAHALEVEPAVILYLPHLAAEEALGQDDLAITLQQQGELYALDVRGLGETLQDDALDFWHPYNVDYLLHGHWLMLGGSYLGRRVYDVLRTIALLVSEGARAVHLVGRGQGAILALFAALLDERVTRVTLVNAPASFQEWASVPIERWPAASVLPGVLEHFDVPDCLRVLGGRAEVLNPWGPEMEPDV